MKSKFLMFAVAVAIVSAFLAAGCGGGDDKKDNPTGGDGGGGRTAGMFIVTGIPSEYNGKYAYAGGGGGSTALHGCQSVSPLTFVQIANGSVSLPMWASTNSGVSYSAYTGSGTANISFGIFESQTVTGDSAIASGAYYSVTFSNGGATRTWSQCTGCTVLSKGALIRNPSRQVLG
jgi:hypothetical protein